MAPGAHNRKQVTRAQPAALPPALLRVFQALGRRSVFTSLLSLPPPPQMLQSFRSHYVYSDGGTINEKEWNKILKNYCYPLSVAHEEALVQVRRCWSRAQPCTDRE